ncbi:MAG: hypothetical protein ACREH5_01490 [Candidatus Omnitrophota bacterium]
MKRFAADVLRKMEGKLSAMSEFGLLYASFVKLETLGGRRFAGMHFGGASGWLLKRMGALEEQMKHRGTEAWAQEQKLSMKEIVQLARYQELRDAGTSPKEALATIRAEGLDKKEAASQMKTLTFKNSRNKDITIRGRTLTDFLAQWRKFKGDHTAVVNFSAEMNKLYESDKDISYKESVSAEGRVKDNFRFSTKEEKEIDTSKKHVYAINIAQALYQKAGETTSVIKGKTVQATAIMERQIDFLEAYHPNVYERAFDSKGTALVAGRLSKLGKYLEGTFIPYLKGEKREKNETVGDWIRAMGAKPNQSVMDMINEGWHTMFMTHEFQHVRDDAAKGEYFGQAESAVYQFLAASPMPKKDREGITRLARETVVEMLPHLRSAHEDNDGTPSPNGARRTLFQLMTYLTNPEAQHYKEVAGYIFGEFARRLGMKGELFKDFTAHDVMEKIGKQADPAAFVMGATKELYQAFMKDGTLLGRIAVARAEKFYRKYKGAVNELKPMSKEERSAVTLRRFELQPLIDRWIREVDAEPALGARIADFMGKMGDQEAVAERLAIMMVTQNVNAQEIEKRFKRDLRDLAQIIDKIDDSQAKKWKNVIDDVDQQRKDLYEKMEKKTGQPRFESGYPPIKGRVVHVRREDYDKVKNWKGSGGWFGEMGVVVMPFTDETTQGEYRAALSHEAGHMTNVGFWEISLDEGLNEQTRQAREPRTTDKYYKSQVHDLNELKAKAHIAQQELETAYAHGDRTMVKPTITIKEWLEEMKGKVKKGHEDEYWVYFGEHAQPMTYVQVRKILKRLSEQEAGEIRLSMDELEPRADREEKTKIILNAVTGRTLLDRLFPGMRLLPTIADKRTEIEKIQSRIEDTKDKMRALDETDPDYADKVNAVLDELGKQADELRSKVNDKSLFDHRMPSAFRSVASLLEDLNGLAEHLSSVKYLAAISGDKDAALGGAAAALARSIETLLAVLPRDQQHSLRDFTNGIMARFYVLAGKPAHLEYQYDVKEDLNAKKVEETEKELIEKYKAQMKAWMAQQQRKADPDLLKSLEESLKSLESGLVILGKFKKGEPLDADQQKFMKENEIGRQILVAMTHTLTHKQVERIFAPINITEQVREKIRREEAIPKEQSVGLHRFTGSVGHEYANNIYLALFTTGSEMNDAMGRIQQYFESEPGEKKSSKQAVGNDFKASQLARYYSSVPLDPKKKEDMKMIAFRKKLIDSGMIKDLGDGKYAAEGPEKALLALSVDLAQKNPKLFDETLEHELLGHGIHFASAKRQRDLDRLWEGLSKKQRVAFTGLLQLVGYTNKEHGKDLVLTEFGAYMRDQQTLLDEVNSLDGEKKERAQLYLKSLGKDLGRGLFKELEKKLKALDPPFGKMGDMVSVQPSGARLTPEGQILDAENNEIGFAIRNADGKIAMVLITAEFPAGLDKDALARQLQVQPEMITHMFEGVGPLRVDDMMPRGARISSEAAQAVLEGAGLPEFIDAVLGKVVEARDVDAFNDALGRIQAEFAEQAGLPDESTDAVIVRLLEKMLAEKDIVITAINLQDLAEAARHYLAFAQIKLAFSAPGMARATIVQSANTLSADGETLNNGARRALEAMREKETRFLKSHNFIVQVFEDGALKDELEALGVRVIVAANKFELERELARITEGRVENLIYTYAVGESDQAKAILQGMETEKGNIDKKIVIASAKEVQNYMKINGEYAFFLPAEGHSSIDPLTLKSKVTVVGDPAAEFKKYLQDAFQGFVNFIKSPWEALKRAYLAMRMAAISA